MLPEEGKLSSAIAASDASLVWNQEDQGVSGKTSIEYGYNHAGTTNGTSAADVLVGSADADIIYGKEGNDTISGLYEDDRLSGDAGNDTIYGGDGDDRASGGDGDDIIHGDNGDDQIWGGAGNNTLDGGLGNDIIIGGSGNDTLIDGYGTGGQNLLQGGGGINCYKIVGSADVFIDQDASGWGFLELPTAYSDESDLTFAFTNNLLHITGSIPGSEISVYINTPFSDTERVQYIRFSSHDYNLINILTGLNTYGTNEDDTIQSVNLLSGNTYADTIYGLDGNDQISGQNGNDYLFGGDGDDTIHGDDGSDHLYGGAGNDILEGGSGDDSYYISFTANQSDRIVRDSSGSDTIYFSGVNAEQIRFWSSGSGLEIITDTNLIRLDDGLYEQNIEQVIFDDNTVINLTGGLTFTGTSDGEIGNGTYYNDIILGKEGDDYLGGYDGDDEIHGDEGNDNLLGYTGNDILVGGVGNDYLEGNDGDDTYVFHTGDGDDIVRDSGMGGTDTIYLMDLDAEDISFSMDGGDLLIKSGTDQIRLQWSLNSEWVGDEIEQIKFSDNTFLNLSGGLTFSGTTGDDIISGSVRNDILIGLSGNDILSASSGNDTIIGGTGSDDLEGGSGDDTYIFNSGDGTDTIYEGANDGGFDTILFTDIEIGDARLWINNTGDLSVFFDTSKITIQKDSSNDAIPVEQIVFENDETISLSGGLVLMGTNIGEIGSGTAANDTIYGLGGNDTLFGGAGDDLIYGGDGNDILQGELGADILYGGNGNDTYIFDEGYYDYDEIQMGHIITEELNGGYDTIKITSNGDISLKLWTTVDGSLLIRSNNEVDAIVVTAGVTGNGYSESTIGQYIENINLIKTYYGTSNYSLTGGLELEGTETGEMGYGTAFNDLIRGQGGNDIIYGNGGNDSLQGGQGNDTIYGNSGNDYLEGGYGDDLLEGGDGNDIIYFGEGADNVKGDAGADTFTLSYEFDSNIDTILDFNLSQGDKIDISQLFANYDVYNHDISDFLQIIAIGSDSVLKFDYDGIGEDFTMEHFLTFAGVIGLTETSLIGSGVLIVGTENVAPTAYDDEFETSKNQPITGNVLADNGYGADKDLNFNALSVVANTMSTSNGGTVALLANGSFTYTPSNNYEGVDSFEYEVSDGSLIGTATVYIAVLGGNIAPVAQNDAFTINHGNNTTGNLIANNGSGADSDSDGGTLSVVESLITTTQGRSVSVSANGNFVYHAMAGFIGTDTFDYTLSDGQGGTDTATVSITINAPSGAVLGTTSADTITSGGTVFGLAGNDTITGAATNDFLYGGAGNDTIYGGNGSDTIYGDVGADMIYGGTGNEMYYFDGPGSAEGDVIEDNGNASGDDDRLYFLNLTSSAVPYLQVAGNGLDMLVVSEWGTLTIKNQFSSDTTDKIERMHWSQTSTPNQDSIALVSAAISLYGDSGNNTITMPTYNVASGSAIYGLDGNDTLNGGSGIDKLYGGDGSDTLYGGNGVDHLYGGAGQDFMYGQAGGDNLYIDAAYENDVIEGGAGGDFYRFTEASYINGYIIEDNAAANEVSDNVVIYNLGSIVPPTLHLLSGNSLDLIVEIGSFGSFTIKNQFASDSKDRIEGLMLYTGTSGGGNNYDIYTQALILHGSDGNDILTMPAYGITNNNPNTLKGLAGNDTVTGSSYADYLYGGDDNDTLFGGDGNDYLYGDAGNDILRFSNGVDTVSGGAGADTFMFDATNTNSDTISDFNLSQSDKIDISDILQGYDPLTHAITDFVQITTNGANSILKVDTNGGGNSFVQIATISGVTGLTDEAALVTSGHLVVT
jgi:trimeric autotransporter adhesin